MRRSLRRAVFASLVVAAVALLTVPATARMALRPGQLDATFDGDGLVTFGTRISNFHYANDVAVDRDDRLVVAGAAAQCAILPCFSRPLVARLLPDGSLDSSFGGDGKVAVDLGYGNNYAVAVALQSDGKIVTAVQVNAFLEPQMAVMRYRRGGTLDRSFGEDGVRMIPFPRWGSIPVDIDVTEDGAILIGGNVGAWMVPEIQSNAAVVVRLTPAGNLDRTFGDRGRAKLRLGPLQDFDYPDVHYVEGIAVLRDGGVLVAANTTRGLAVARLAPTGQLDGSFGSGGILHTDLPGRERAGGLALHPDGGFVVVGRVSRAGHRSLFVVRYRSNGGLYRRFAEDGVGTYEAPGGNEVVVQSDGRIVTAGLPGWGIVRLLPSGVLDDSFGRDGIVRTDIGDDGLPDQANAIVVAGNEVVVAGLSITGNFGPLMDPLADVAIARYIA